MSNNDPKPKDPKRGLTRLHDLEPAEISLVDSGANRRRMLVLKRSDISTVDKGGPGSGPHPGGGDKPAPDKKPTVLGKDRSGGLIRDEKVHSGYGSADAMHTHERIASAHYAAADQAKSEDRKADANHHEKMGKYHEAKASEHSDHAPNRGESKEANDHVAARPLVTSPGGKYFTLGTGNASQTKATRTMGAWKESVHKAGEPDDDMEHAELVAKGGPGSGPQKGGGSGGGKTEDKKEIGKTESGKSVSLAPGVEHQGLEAAKVMATSSTGKPIYAEGHHAGQVPTKTTPESRAALRESNQKAVSAAHPDFTSKDHADAAAHHVAEAQRQYTAGNNDKALAHSHQAGAHNALGGHSGVDSWKDGPEKSKVHKAASDGDKDDDMEHAELVAKGGPGSGPQKGGGSGGGLHEAEDKGKGKGKTIGITSTGKPIFDKAGNSGHKGFTGQDHQEAYAAHSVLGAQAQDRGDMKAAEHHGEQQSTHRAKMEAHATLGEKLRDFGDAHAAVQIHGTDHPRTHAVHKAADTRDADVSKKMRDMIAKTDPAVLAAVDKAFDGYVKKDAGGEPDAQMVAAGKAVARILTPFKGSMPPALAHQIVDVAGFNMGEMGDEDTTPGAMRVGDGSQVEKAAKDDGDDDEDDVSKMGGGCVATQVDKSGGSPVNKKGEQVSKSAADTQTNGAPDLSGIADPKTRSAVELVMKSQRELVAKNAALETSNVDLKKSLDDQKAETRKKELVAKAAGWQHLAVPQDDLVAQLVDADKAGKEAFERVEKNFNALNAQAQTGRLFGEIGSNLPRGGGSGPDASYAKMEAAAMGWVQKSGEKCSKEEALSKFLETPEGRKMYAEHQAARPGGI